MADSSPSPGWTDHNAHDPGVTMMQLLVYSLGALALATMSAIVVSRRRSGLRDCD